jgi:hypothetical protein
MSMLVPDEHALETRSLSRNQVLFANGDKVAAIYWLAAFTRSTSKRC